MCDHARVALLGMTLCSVLFAWRCALWLGLLSFAVLRFGIAFCECYNCVIGVGLCKFCVCIVTCGL